MEPSVGATPKFSRYRSVRKAAAEGHSQWTGEASVGSNPTAKSPSETIARSMSRYHRPKTPTVTTPTIPPTANHPPVPALPSSIQCPPTGSGSLGTAVHICSADKAQESQRQNRYKASSHHQSDKEDDLSEVEKAQMREEAMKKLTMAEKPKASSSSAPAKPQTPQESQSKNRSEHKRASWKDKLGLSQHKKTAGPLHSDPTSHSEDNQIAMDASARHLVPGIDAPVSAVNSGERRVLVKFRSNSIKLPVTPTTRVKDIIYSAANCFSERVDPLNAIIVESFLSLGLERPLRRYEHVRDVLNSWSADNVHALVMSDSPSEGASHNLELKAAPSAQPKDCKFYLYHSSKPGKWDKRYVTLRADGQIVVSKKSDAREKDSTNICHMSDFDIYTPTGRQVSKTLRPPKKICFAIKSQQKSSMFISTENFVHFFATNDSPLAQNFHDAVHGWRSWYLVHVLGVGQNQKQVDAPNTAAPDVASSPVHQRHVSTDSLPYQLGSFKPLVEFGRNVEPAVAVAAEKDSNGKSTRDMFMRRKQARDRAPPPSSFPGILPSLDTKNEPHSSEDDSSSPFSPDSLLGRTYSQRLAVQREREAKESDENGPFVAHGLLNNLRPTSPDQSSQHMPYTSNPPSRQNSRSNTIKSHHLPMEGLSQTRSNSTRQKAKPLVDLTPTFREPPQHARKGHGVKVDAGVPLVEAATGLESITGMATIPSATTWRREDVMARPTTSANESSSASIMNRHRANTQRSQHHQSGFSNPSDAATPFMPNGLIALSSSNNTANTQANTSIGRGVATGDRHATRPLLDMTPQSQFVEGSLLRNIERSQ